MENFFESAIYVPRILLKANGQINIDLIDKIWSLHPKARGAKKSLSKALVNSAKVTSTAQAFEEIVSDKRLFAKWFEQALYKERSMCTLILRVAAAEDQALRFESLEVLGFLEKKKELNDAYRFNIEKLDCLMEVIRKFKGDPDILGLYVWAIIVESRAAAWRYPKESSFPALEPMLLKALEESDLTEVLSKIEAVSVRIREEASAKSSGTKNNNNSTLDHLKSKFFEESRNRSQQLRRLEDRCAAFNRELSIISSRTHALQFEPGICESLSSLVSLAELLKNDAPKITEEYRSFAASLNDTIGEKIKFLGLQLAPHELEGKPAEWSAELESRIKTLYDIDCLLANGGNQTIQERQLPGSFEIEVVSREKLVGRVQERLYEILDFEHARKQYENLVESIKANHLDLSWQAFSDSDSDSEIWGGVFRHCIYSNSISPLMGIGAYRTFSQTERQLANTLRSNCLADEESLHSSLDVLSCLNAAQLETLAKHHADLKTIVSLALLEGFLSAADTQSYSYAYTFWSIYPLSESYATHSSLAVKNVFAALFELSMHEESPLSYQSLKIAISTAKTDGADNKEQELARLNGQLAEMLRYRRKSGGVTYSQIWEAAYNSTLNPLNKIYLKSGMSAFFNAYRKWVDEFEIDKNIEIWKAEIPEHLKKNSVYDKFIRTQLQLKINELNGLDEIYSSLITPQNVRGEILSRLKAAIKMLLKSGDKDAAIMRAWLEIKASGAKTLFNPYMSTGRTLIPGREIYGLSKADVRYPRMFSSHDAASIMYSKIYTDLVIKALNLNSPDNLIKSYLKHNFIDGVQRLISDGSFDISPEVERTAERKLEEVSSMVYSEMASLSLSVSIDTDGTLRALLQQAKELLEDGHVRRAQALLEEATQVAEELKVRLAECELKERIIDKLKHLQDNSYDASSSAAELERYYQKQLEGNQLKRRHIFVLKRLEAVPQPELAAAVIESVESLECYGRYPDAATSETVAFYWEQAIDPLLKELVRSKTLRPDYVEKLLQLGGLVCRNIIEDFYVIQENSCLNQALLQTAEQWASLPDTGLEAANNIFESFKRQGITHTISAIDELSASEGETVYAPFPPGLVRDELTDPRDALVEMARKWQIEHASVVIKGSSNDLIEAIRSNNWKLAQQISFARLASSNFEEKEELDNWVISSALASNQGLNIIGRAFALKLISPKATSQVARYLSTDRSAKPLIEALSLSFIIKLAQEAGWSLGERELNASNIGECIQYLSENFDAAIKCRDAFRIAYSTSNADSISLKALWDKFSGGPRQAEARAQIMALAWRFGASDALAFCLTQPPIDMEKRKSHALAMAADQALISGNSNLLQPFLDLRSKLTARPFQLLVDILSRSIIDSNELPAKLQLISSLEKQPDQTYRATIKIEPRRVDSPDSITLRLPSNAPVRFPGSATNLVLNGPFLIETTIQLAFEITDSTAQSFDIQITCLTLSITGKNSEFAQKLRFVTSGAQAFSPLSVEEIEEAFDYFPSNHMRGDEYVPRVTDEQKIERALFKSKIVRSLWITSPRRSGKTSMLYRIVDAYSHKEGRDNLVIYLTIDAYFESVAAFNRWMWKRIQSIRPNEELRALYEDFTSIGLDLPYDADAGTFIGNLADRLLANWSQATRVIFLIDEVDRLASMYFQGGKDRSTAMDILWQIRHFIAERRDIGIVFAGSSAAKELFISRAESPFYNSIDHLELSSFSARTKQQEEYSRQLVEPSKVRGTYTLPKETLEYLIWVCSGIPYYMKLVAGATLSRAKQSYLLVSDVNEGLRALLNRDTGISKLDDMGGEPGSDDLRTIVGLDQASDALLAKAVLYAFADIHSPLSGNKTYRGKISSPESKLIYVYSLSRPMIDKGLDLCLKLGLLKLVATDTTPALDFVIPLLGEAIRKASPRLWATIDHELFKLASVGEKT